LAWLVEYSHVLAKVLKLDRRSVRAHAARSQFSMVRLGMRRKWRKLSVTHTAPTVIA